MPTRFILPLLAAVFLLCPGTARAHGVSMSAVVSGDEVILDCEFGPGRKLSGGDVAVADAATGVILLRGVTDGAGAFRFRPPSEALAAGHGLRVSVSTSDGHHAEREIRPEELRRLSGAEAGRSAAGHGAAGFDAAELEEVVRRVVEAQLLPVRQEMARAAAAAAGGSGPNFQSIIGGLGWIAGALGLAAYLKSRPPAKQ